MQVLHQAVLTSDGKATFAAFIYDNETISIAKAFEGDILAGFDAGDQVRSLTTHSPGFSSLQNLEEINIFRIDGKASSKASSINKL